MIVLWVDRKEGCEERKAVVATVCIERSIETRGVVRGKKEDCCKQWVLRGRKEGCASPTCWGSWRSSAPGMQTFNKPPFFGFRIAAQPLSVLALPSPGNWTRPLISFLNQSIDTFYKGPKVECSLLRRWTALGIWHLIRSLKKEKMLLLRRWVAR